ncbi:MAG: IclR family transcriptional regulator [Hyphomonadaceae bacterium]
MTNPPTLALDKSLSLLSLLVADDGEHSVSALAEEAGVPTATAHRIVATFERRGFVTRVARGRYLAGPALLRLANAATLNKVLEAAGRPIVQALAKQTGLTAHLGVFEGDMVTYLIKAGRGGEGLFTREGMQLEAYCSGIGKMLLALLPDEQRERYLAGGPFVALTANTITDANRLRAELERVRAQGFARDECEIDADLRCVAAAVRDDKRAAIAALSLSARQERGDLDPAQHLDALRAAARALELRLFPQSS